MLGGLGGLVGGALGGPVGAIAGNVVGGLLGGSGGASFEGILGDQMTKNGAGIMTMLLQPMLNDMLSELGDDSE